MEMKNTLPHIFNCEKTIFDKKKFEKCDMTSFNLGKQKQPLEVFNKKGVLKNFAKVAGKHLCQSLFFNNVAGRSKQLYLKRDSDTGVSCEFFGIFKITSFIEHLWATSSGKKPSNILRYKKAYGLKFAQSIIYVKEYFYMLLPTLKDLLQAQNKYRNYRNERPFKFLPFRRGALSRGKGEGAHLSRGAH